MEIKTLNKWADLLLDTGKRNNLINFKNTKMGAVEIIAPDFSALFSQVENATEFEVYDPKLEEDDEDEVTQTAIVFEEEKPEAKPPPLEFCTKTIKINRIDAITIRIVKNVYISS